jgi:flagellar biosynthesis protein FlhG
MYLVEDACFCEEELMAPVDTRKTPFEPLQGVPVDLRQGRGITVAEEQGGRAKFYAVTSGKGGVGKTTFVMNVAVELALQKNRSTFRKNRVLVIDSDIGLANLHLRFYKNIHEKGTIMTLLQSRKSGDKLREEVDLIRYKPDHALELYIIAGSCADEDIFRLSSRMKKEFEELFTYLGGSYDYIFFDCGAGITRTNSFFEGISDEVIICTNYEEAAVLGAYATIKINVLQNEQTSFSLVVNRADKAEGESCHKTLDKLVHDKLQIPVRYLGNVRKDDALIRKSAVQRMPVYFIDRNAEIRKDYFMLGHSLIGKGAHEIQEAPVKKDFLSKIVNLFSRQPVEQEIE